MKNILITSSNKKVSLIKRFKEASSQYGNVKIFTSDVKYVVTANFSDNHFILPYDNDKSYIYTLLNVCLSNKIGLIIPTRDDEILNLKQYKDDFEKIGCKILIPTDDVIETCLNKQSFAYFCKSNSINIPKTYDSDEKYLFPIFCKPKYGSASKNCFVIYDESQLPNNLNDYLLQEFLEWDEYSVDVFCDFNSIPLSIVPRKRIEVLNGESQITIIDLNQKIIDSVKKMLEKINLIGHNVIQCFHKNDVVKFIEVNLRFGGASNASFEAGADSTKMLLSILNGKSVNEIVVQDGLIMQRFSDDVFPNKRYQGKVFCVDIDGTLCTENPNLHYDYATPIQKSIDYINKLYESGNIIKLYTARGAVSGIDWRDVTESQMKKWGVKYHELIMKKPFADYYIDNKAINIFNFINYEK